jgi:hypothetical protein
MRHLGSLIAGAIIAPLAWLLIALGQQQSVPRVADIVTGDAASTSGLVGPVSMLAGAGILLGLVATLRISPAGSLLAGLFYVGAYVGLLVAPARVHSAVPGSIHVLGQHITPRNPLDNGTLLVVGALLLVSMVSAHRWRRWPDGESVADEPEPHTNSETEAARGPLPQRQPGDQTGEFTAFGGTGTQPVGAAAPTGEGPPEYGQNR